MVKNSFPSHITVPFCVEKRHCYYYIIGEKISPIAAAVTEKLGLYSFVGAVSDSIYIEDPDNKNSFFLVPLSEELLEIERELAYDIDSVKFPISFSLYLPLKSCPLIDRSGEYIISSKANEIIYQVKTKEFKGKGWLDNGWISNTAVLDTPIELSKGIVFNTVENYYQAMKTKDPLVRSHLAGLSALEAKKYWSKYRSEIRKDWEDIREQAMFKALKHKFKQKKFLYNLVMSYPSPIIEFNNWADEFWGVYIKRYEGKNMLGRMIMKIRSRYMDRIPF